MASAGANTALEKLAIYIIAPLLVAGIIGMIVMYGQLTALTTSVNDLKESVRQIQAPQEQHKPIVLWVRNDD